jgi:hypothetical protein
MCTPRAFCKKIYSCTNFNFHRHTFMSRDSSVGIATGYGLDDRGVGVRGLVWSRIFSSPRRSDRLWDPPTSYPNGTGSSFPGSKATGARS